jgi:hypothetical protein
MKEKKGFISQTPYRRFYVREGEKRGLYLKPFIVDLYVREKEVCISNPLSVDLYVRENKRLVSQTLYPSIYNMKMRLKRKERGERVCIDFTVRRSYLWGFLN